MTGPIVYTKAINMIHMELFNEIINHPEINENTDITYKSNNISYRLYGIDYNNYCTYKDFDVARLLYFNKKHWQQEAKEQDLIN